MTFEKQRKILNDLRYTDYKDYLAGLVWAKIREKALELHGNRCVVCSRNATVIHHREYTEEVLRGTDITPLEPLCWDCHQRVEYDEYGKKICLARANNKLDWYRQNKHIWMKCKWSPINLKVQKERRRFKSPLLE